MQIPPSSSERVALGADPQVSPSPGDLIFVKRRNLVGLLITLGQKIRPSLRKWSDYNHVACTIDDHTVVEALGRGIVYTPLSHYTGGSQSYVIYHSHLEATDQEEAVKFFTNNVGKSYGLLIFLGTALRMLTPGRGLYFGMDGTEICSGLAAQGLERGWYIFSQLAASLCPAELARDLNLPEKGSRRMRTKQKGYRE